MINLGVFGFLTGVHLALLQFCYFFLLLINVTSTSSTYATIVISWMVGTLIGLYWRRLNAGLALIAGVASYYAIYALVLSDPLALHTLPIAAGGVAVSGLWAGRFFVVMLPLFARADRLFLHENNGFLLGVVGVLIGFTMLGQRFLLATPLVRRMAIMAGVVDHPDEQHKAHRYPVAYLGGIAVFVGLIAAIGCSYLFPADVPAVYSSVPIASVWPVMRNRNGVN